MVSTVLAFRRAGAPLALQVLLGASVLIGAHAPPLASIGWACFAAAGWMVLRARHTAVEKPAALAAAVGATRDLCHRSSLREPHDLPISCAQSGGRPRLFVLGVATIALHVLDDSFLQPPPGTSAGDHLVGGLVPLAVLALAAWAYPRLRGGRRGALALVFRAFGIVAGVEAVHYTRQGRGIRRRLHRPARDPRGPAAARPRRRHAVDDAADTTATARGATCAACCSELAGVAVALFVVAPLGAGYLFTHLGRPVVPAANLGADYEHVSFTTSDGLELSGWYVPSKNGAAVIAFPGRNGPRRTRACSPATATACCSSTAAARARARATRTPSAGRARRTSRPPIAFLQRRPDVDPERIGGLGLSVGGELMLHAAAETDALKAVVSEGAGSRSVGEFRGMPGGSVASTASRP